MNAKVVPLVTRPRCEFGVDWGRPRKVLIRCGKLEVQHVPGYTGWAGIGMTDYYNTHVVVISYAGRGDIGRTLFEGRASKQAWQQALPKLREFLGADFDHLHLISLHSTLELTK